MGKKTRMRECPAAGREIEAFECAAGRHTTYSCPERCPFDPFSPAHYDQFRQIEQSADAKFLQWIFENVADRNQFAAGLDFRIGDAPNNPYFHYLAWHGVYRKDSNGETCVEQWSKSAFRGLTSDERVLMRGRMKMRPAMIEIHRVLDDKRLEVVDLIDPMKPPFTVVDRGLAQQAVRFGVYAVHTFPLPHYFRVFGACLMLPSLPPLDPEEVVTQIIRHLGGVVGETGMRCWLAVHYEKFEDALTAVALARRRSMFDQLDAQFGKAVYELMRSFAECRARLAEVLEIEDDPLSLAEETEGFVEGRVWFAKQGDPDLDYVGEGATLGRILLGKTHWRLDAMGGARLDTLRERFQSLMGNWVRFAGERKDDLGARIRNQSPRWDEALVPPALLRDPVRIVTAVSRLPASKEPISKGKFMEDYLRQRDIEFLDENVPALNGRTPRQAASDSALRPDLIRLMKERIRDCDTRNLETAGANDLNWMLRELGLNEILFDPPPLRPRFKLASIGPEDEEFEEQPEFLDFPAPPPLPDQPWTQPEAMARFQEVMASFSSLSEPLDYLLEMDYPLFDDLREVVGDAVLEREYQFLDPIMALLVLCFAPCGTNPPEIYFDDLNGSFLRELQSLEGWPRTAVERQFAEWVSQCAQPELLTVFFNLTNGLTEEAPAKLRPRTNVRLTFFIILRIVINELDRALREGS